MLTHRDAIDAEAAARKVLSGEATSAAKDTAGIVEARSAGSASPATALPRPARPLCASSATCSSPPPPLCAPNSTPTTPRDLTHDSQRRRTRPGHDHPPLRPRRPQPAPRPPRRRLHAPGPAQASGVVVTGCVLRASFGQSRWASLHLCRTSAYCRYIRLCDIRSVADPHPDASRAHRAAAPTPPAPHTSATRT